MSGSADVSAQRTSASWFGRLKIASLNAVAWFLYGVGLISPLTPSEGMPGVVDVVIFVVGPVAVLIFLARRFRSMPAKITMIVQAVAIVTFTGWLLAIQAGAM